MPFDFHDGVYTPRSLGEPQDMAFDQWKMSKDWTYTIDQKYLSHRKAADFKTRQMISHICPMCGGDVQAFASQTLFAPGRITADDMHETSLTTPLMPVRQQEDGSFLVLSAEDAINHTTSKERREINRAASKKKKGFFAKLFG